MGSRPYGTVRFEAARLSGPFELCHCSRYHKLSGSTYMPMIGVRAQASLFLKGEANIRWTGTNSTTAHCTQRSDDNT